MYNQLVQILLKGDHMWSKELRIKQNKFMRNLFLVLGALSLAWATAYAFTNQDIACLGLYATGGISLMLAAVYHNAAKKLLAKLNS